jgi:SAM-dependent methyltransferase
MMVEILTQLYRWLRDHKRRLDRYTRWPPVGAIDLGDLRRLTPISKVCGLDRGKPIDRYYIENFLSRQAADIQGCVLEIGDSRYTQRFGGDRVIRSDVLHINLHKPGVTIVGDLAGANPIPADTFDCLILTQTLQCIYDIRAAVRTCFHILRPGGVILSTFPGTSQIYRPIFLETYDDLWRLTVKAAQKIFTEVFPFTHVSVQAHGNVLVATALLYGLASEELQPTEIDYQDPDYEVLITVRAAKPVA